MVDPLVMQMMQAAALRRGGQTQPFTPMMPPQNAGATLPPQAAIGGPAPPVQAPAFTPGMGLPPQAQATLPPQAMGGMRQQGMGNMPTPNAMALQNANANARFMRPPAGPLPPQATGNGMAQALQNRMNRPTTMPPVQVGPRRG